MEGAKPPPLVITAGLAAALLIASVGWQLGGEMRSEQNVEGTLAFERAKTDTASAPRFDGRDWQEELARLGLISTSTDAEYVFASSTVPEISEMISEQLLTGYEILKGSGRYTPERAALLGTSIGSNARIPVAFVVHGESELQKSGDVSKEGALKYRADMRDALSILVTNDPPEWETFGEYIEARNPERLYELEEAAERYRAAEKAALAVVVPQDAASLHLRAVNALGAYANSLDQLIRYADDALATLAVLNTYNEAEREMLYAFDALASYYVRKTKE